MSASAPPRVHPGGGGTADAADENTGCGRAAPDMSAGDERERPRSAKAAVAARQNWLERLLAAD